MLVLSCQQITELDVYHFIRNSKIRIKCVSLPDLIITYDRSQGHMDNCRNSRGNIFKRCCYVFWVLFGSAWTGVPTDDHNIYYNVATQILTSKLNINNQVTSCSTVNDAIKYADDVLHSVNYQGIGTASQELTDSQMQNIINVHAVLSQFNTNGCAAISPTGLFFTPS